MTLCAICATAEAAPVICEHCRTRIRRDLDTVGRLRSQLDPTPGRAGPGGRPTGKPGSRPPANLTVIAMADARSHFAFWHCGHTPDQEPCPNPRCGGEADPDNVANIDADLLTEARWVIEERHLNPPMRDAFDSLRILNIHFEWIVRHPRADEFALVVNSCARGLRAVRRDWPDPMIGLCPAAHPTRDACGGPLHFDYRGPLPTNPEHHSTPTHVVCAWCKDETLVDTYLWQVMRALPAHARIPVTREWAASTWNINPATVRTWIHRGHIRTYGDGSIDLIDVLTLLKDTDGTRHADPSMLDVGTHDRAQ